MVSKGQIQPLGCQHHRGLHSTRTYLVATMRVQERSGSGNWAKLGAGLVTACWGQHWIVRPRGWVRRPRAETRGQHLGEARSHFRAELPRHCLHQFCPMWSTEADLFPLIPIKGLGGRLQKWEEGGRRRKVLGEADW